MFLIFLLYALLASTFTIGKILLLYLPPLFLIGLRMSIAGIFLSAVYYMYAKQKLSIDLKGYTLLGLISIVHIFIPYTTEFIALQQVAPAHAALMYSLSPFFTALFSYLFFNEKMTLLKWIGLTVSFIAIALFLQPTSIADISIVSYGLLLVSVFCASLGWILVRMLVKKKKYSPIFINSVAMILGGLQSFIASKLYGEVVLFPWQEIYNFTVWLSASIIIANILFYNLYGFLLRRYTATLLSFVGFVTPFFTGLFDWYFLQIPMSSNFILTVLVVGLGIYLFYKEELKQGYVL